MWSVVEVDQFYGIEIGEFPTRIAATALWMMDHIMNNRLSLEFGHTYARSPIEKAPHIRNADALEIDWADVLPPDECSYVFGNPPFGGAKYQSPEQRAQVRRVAALGGCGGTLDYVTAWFIPVLSSSAAVPTLYYPSSCAGSTKTASRNCQPKHSTPRRTTSPLISAGCMPRPISRGGKLGGGQSQGGPVAGACHGYV